jgi:CheY-like chemotaxis protein
MADTPFTPQYPNRPSDARVGAEQLAALSHEFRTPLNGVLGMARLLEGTALTDEQRTYVTALRDSGEHLLGLVNDLLDFAKLGASKVELRPSSFEIEDLLRGVCELLAPRAQEKGLEIAWAAPGGIGSVQADEGRLRQVLLNFAGNAIKFTETGGVLLTVAEAGAGRLRFTALPRRRGSSARPLAGRTIGVISPNPVIAEAARRQIEACGGRALVAARTPVPAEAEILLVDHTLDPSGPPDARPALILLTPEARGRIDDYRARGFAGYLIKPLRRASLAERVLAAAGAKSRRSADDERVAAAAAPGARVLLVEDNAINALLARTLLGREGCAVDHATGGQEALAALAVGAYDLILMDMRMPGLSGLETTRRLRDLGVQTPVVALTANVFEEDRHACLEAGMDDFLMKPLAADSLRRVLTKLTRGGWTETAARAKLG